MKTWIWFIAPMVLAVACQNASPQFNLLPAEETGIRFANRITESDTFNILDFEYVYNGGGVGVGDFDGNGLPDLYFTGNMVANELYLNQGDFKFKEVALEAGVAGRRRWCSGVAVVDINADGRPDLYVSATVHQDPARRANQLFINQGPEKGIPRFKEMAAEYGLADTTHTTNTAFFDYDNDGDLDAYVLVNQMTGTTYPNKYRPKVTDGTAPTNDRLYRNDWDSLKGHPVFTNVSQAAGIRYEGFGLGLHLGDLNRDGWKDIYVTNDYLNNDLLYLNQGNGTFINVADTAFKHTCYSAMGNDVADLNNDGLADIVALDMMPEYNRRKKMMLAANNYNHYVNNEKFGYQHQYVRNVLQLNQGNLPGKNYPGFSDIGLLAGVAETDWSWAPLAADFDNDGWRDLFITNGFPKDITDRDFVIYRGQMSHLATKEMLLEAIPRVKLPNYAYRNRGDLTFEDMTQAWGFATPSFSNGAAYADLDNDGDLDYVVNNIDDSAHVYRNFLRERQPEASNFLRIKFAGPGQNRAGLGAIVEFSLSEGQKVVYEHTPYRGYLSSVEAVAHFGLGRQTQVAQLRVIWPNGTQQVLRNVAANQVLTVSAGQATERYQPAATAGVPAFTEVGDSLGLQVVHQEWDAIDFNLQKLLPHKFTQFGPALAVGDVNQDGRDDLFMGGGNYHKGRWFLQGPNGRFMERDLLPGAANDKTSEDLGALLFDADGDQDLDLYLVSGGYDGQPGHASYRDRFYENQGGTFTARPEALPDLFTSGASVKAADFDRDGDLDLFVGGRVVPGQYPKPAASHLLRNDSRPGAPQFTEVTAQVAPALQAPGLVCDALWTDYDRDGWPDLLLAGEFMPLTFYQNQKGKLVPAPASPELASKVGWWNSLAAGDFDNDGDTDYVAGNLGLNSLNRASPAQPVRVYAGDFDKDGLYDALPFAFFRGENGQRQEFPFFGREEHIKQMVSYRMKFPGFAPFAEAGPAQLLTDEQRQAALVCEANYFASVYVENLGKGQFKVRALPTMAQLAPVFGLLPFDADADAHLDLLLVGNDYGTEVMQGRLDALNGLVLQGDGRGNFTPLSLGASGFYVPGDAKALVQITDYQGRALVVASQNRGPLRVFRPRQAGQVVPFQPTNLAATLRWPSGASRRVEAYWGSGFLGQSARGVVVPPGAALAPALGQ